MAKKEGNKEVLEFIRKIRTFKDHGGNETDAITNLFGSGYCYYFAVMLQNVFGGQVCWVEGYGHIVWLDGDDPEKDIAYDIYGIYEDYDRLRPASYLGDLLLDFLHTGREYVCGDRAFRDWCEFYKVSDIYAITDIWKRIPKEKLKEYDAIGADCEQAALLYWVDNKKVLREVYAEKKYEYLKNLKEKGNNMATVKLCLTCPSCGNSTWLPAKDGSLECLACGDTADTEESAPETNSLDRTKCSTHYSR